MAKYEDDERRRDVLEFLANALGLGTDPIRFIRGLQRALQDRVRAEARKAKQA